MVLIYSINKTKIKTLVSYCEGIHWLWFVN